MSSAISFERDLTAASVIEVVSAGDDAKVNTGSITNIINHNDGNNIQAFGFLSNSDKSFHDQDKTGNEIFHDQDANIGILKNNKGRELQANGQVVDIDILRNHGDERRKGQANGQLDDEAVDIGILSNNHVQSADKQSALRGKSNDALRHSARALKNVKGNKKCKTAKKTAKNNDEARKDFQKKFREELDCDPDLVPMVLQGDKSFEQAVSECLASADPSTECPYGWPIGCWKTGLIEDMSKAFYFQQTFNEPIDGWDTSSCKDMSSMFHGAVAFNRDISSWDTSACEDMSRMFEGAVAFNGDISSWDTSACKDMSRMFVVTPAFNRDISTWDTSACKDMSSMFKYASAFNGDIGCWDTSACEDMSYMFDGASAFNGDISSWDTSACKDMSYMFQHAHAFNGDISSWDTSTCETMSFMFSGASAFNRDISSWDVSACKEMSFMFFVAESFDQCLIPWKDKLTINSTTTLMFSCSGCRYQNTPFSPFKYEPWCACYDWYHGPV